LVHGGGWSVIGRHRFAPSCQSLASFISQRVGADANFSLSTPLSTTPPFHAALACLAVMPRWGLHLVPNNLSDILSDYPRVDRMYEPGASFSLDLLVEAVTNSRPHMVRSKNFYWSEVSWRWGRRPPLNGKAEAPTPTPTKAGGGKNATNAEASGSSSSKPPPIVTVRRVAATSKPPLRSWDKRPMPALPLLDLAAKRWRQSEGPRWTSGSRTGADHDHKNHQSHHNHNDKFDNNNNRRKRQRQSHAPKALAVMACGRALSAPIFVPKPVWNF
jgi:hypothetical protein